MPCSTNRPAPRLRQPQRDGVAQPSAVARRGPPRLSWSIDLMVRLVVVGQQAAIAAATQAAPGRHTSGLGHWRQGLRPHPASASIPAPCGRPAPACQAQPQQGGRARRPHPRWPHRQKRSALLARRHWLGQDLAFLELEDSSIPRINACCRVAMPAGRAARRLRRSRAAFLWSCTIGTMRCGASCPVASSSASSSRRAQVPLAGLIRKPSCSFSRVGASPCSHD